MLLAHKSGFKIACSAFHPHPGKEEYKEHGLLKKHAYSILGVYELPLPNGKVLKLVKLRNSWGRFGWKKLFEQFNGEILNFILEKTNPRDEIIQIKPDVDNGIFLMEFKDFF